MRIAVVVLVTLALMGCTMPGSSNQSPSNPASSTAAGGFGAQTVAGDQGQAQTPQTTSAGPATQNWNFASEGDAAVQLELLEALAEMKATPEQIVSALRALNGAPETVEITTGTITIQTGSPEATGASGGTGGGGQIKPVDNP